MTTGSTADDDAEVLRVALPPELKNERLDRALIRLLPGLSRTYVKELVEGGHVRVAGQLATKAGALVSGPSEIELTLARRRSLRVEAPDPRKLAVLFEDAHVVVIDKPPGVLAHPTESSVGSSIAELAALRYGPLPTLQGADRPGIVHRLDAGTSGVMVLARTPEAFAELMRQFRERTVAKSYLALVYGAPRFESGWIQAPIERDPRDSGRMAVAAAGAGRDARTFYSVLERFDGLALVRAEPKSGRTHQIRVHFTSIELPLVGDKLYRRRGGPSLRLPGEAPIPPRQCLHAQTLVFRHPASGESVRVEAPLAADFERMLEWTRVNRAAPNSGGGA